MASTIENTKQNNTSKNTSTTKHHVTANNKMKVKGIFENILVPIYEDRRSKRVVFDRKVIPKKDAILESLSTKFKTQSLWGVEDMGQEKVKGGVRYAIEETL